MSTNSKGIRRKRTMMRKKPLSKLRKIITKSYLQVYDEFMKDLFPGIEKRTNYSTNQR